MSNSVDSPGSSPTRCVSKPGIRRSWPRISGIRSERAALERLAVARADERDDRVVAVLRAAILDRGERRVLVAQLLDDLVDPGVVDGLDLRGEVEAACSRRADLRADLDRRLEDERLAFLGLHDLDVGVRERQDLLLDERLAIGRLDEVLDRVVEDGARAERALEDGARRLAGAEPGDARAAREVLDGLADGAVEPLGRELDLEVDGGLGAGVVVICIAGKYRAAGRGAGRTAASERW